MLGKVTFNSNALQHWSQTQFLEGRSSAQFCSNPNKTHLIQLIKLFRITIYFQAGTIWSWLELNSAELWPSRTWVETSAIRYCFTPRKKLLIILLSFCLWKVMCYVTFELLFKSGLGLLVFFMWKVLCNSCLYSWMYRRIHFNTLKPKNK